MGSIINDETADFQFHFRGRAGCTGIGGRSIQKSGDAGVFGLGGAIPVIDFIMRLLVIKKKSAARYTEDLAIHDHTQRSNDEDQEGESSEPAREEQPLLGREKGEYEVATRPAQINAEVSL